MLRGNKNLSDASERKGKMHCYKLASFNSFFEKDTDNILSKVIMWSDKYFAPKKKDIVVL